ncbi:MAG: hypothetical protein ABR585_15740, partial [Gemmatimonadaceae bacterium]
TMGDQPVALWRSGATEVLRFDAPGVTHSIGTFNRPPDALSLSRDLRRAVVTTSEYHGDAWLMRVIR